MDDITLALQLLIIRFVHWVIGIFLIIIFIRFLANKFKKIENKPTNLYKIFIVFSILICIGLYPIVNSMTSKFPDVYSDVGVEVAPEISNQIAIYVWPILIVYLIMLITMIVKKTSYRTIYYPLALITLTIIAFCLGVIYFNYMFFWYIVIFFIPLILITIGSGVIGNRIDNKHSA